MCFFVKGEGRGERWEGGGERSVEEKREKRGGGMCLGKPGQGKYKRVKLVVNRERGD